MIEKTKIKTALTYILRVNWFISIGVAIVTLFILKKFFFDIVKVSSNDMQPNFDIGNTLLIKKIGSKYISNDVVLFQYPNIDSNETSPLFLQRIVGLPGDSFCIVNKEVYRNNNLQPDSIEKKLNYLIKSEKVKLDSSFWNNYGISEYAEISNELDYSATLTKVQRDSLSKLTYIKSIELKSEKPTIHDETCFPFNSNHKWNMDYFGGNFYFENTKNAENKREQILKHTNLYIPKKNDTLVLDTLNLILYKHIIAIYESNKLQQKNDSIFINGVYTKNYIIKQNYYFTLGDNRDNAIDSRSFGFVPQKFIIGKVVKNFSR